MQYLRSSTLICGLLLLSACASAGARRGADGGAYDVGIRGDRIARIAPRGILANAAAHRRFDASEDNLTLQMRQPWMKFGTDAGGQDPETARGMTHPRAYGNYPRALGRYVREQGVMSLEEAVRKMTSAVATRLSLHDRGILRAGMFADVVVFDPATITDRATYDRPHQLSEGVRHVLVNGVAVVSDGQHTGATPGRAVRKGR
jgi:N-acyl-D-aspartate/D-glutamate deacylase